VAFSKIKLVRSLMKGKPDLAADVSAVETVICFKCVCVLSGHVSGVHLMFVCMHVHVCSFQVMGHGFACAIAIIIVMIIIIATTIRNSSSHDNNSSNSNNNNNNNKTLAVIIKTIRTTIMITIKHFPAHDALDTCKASLVSPEH